MVEVKVDLKGIHVVTTASTRGIGFYVARGLALMGAKVAVTGRDARRVRDTVNDLRSEGLDVYGFVVDLLSKNDLETLIEHGWSVGGKIDAIVFNTGNVSCEPCYLHEARYDDWVEAARRHLIAPGYISSIYISKLLAEGAKGTIIFLSSASVREPMPHFVLADTARAGLVQLAKSIALRYSDKGIRAYTLLLGSFDTPGARKNIRTLAERQGVRFEDAWKRWVIEATPLRRVATPRELALLVALLISGAVEYMTGSTILFDGAMTKCSF